MDQVAIVSGASSGMGLEISKVLCRQYKVLGIARNFSKCDFFHENFVQIQADLSKKSDILEFYSQYKKENIFILVNNAGVGHFGYHEELKTEKIEEMVYLNLTSPMLLSNKFLRILKKNRGFIFNISSMSAINPAVFGAAYGACKSALKHFGTSLFQENRKYGLKVTNIMPDIAKTNFFDELNFTYKNDADYFIDPCEISKIVEMIVNQNMVVSDIVLQPQKFAINKK